MKPKSHFYFLVGVTASDSQDTPQLNGNSKFLILFIQLG